MPTKDPATCPHLAFEAYVNVNRIMADEADETNPDAHAYRFHADIGVKCAECETSFVFLGMPGGYDPARPTTDFLGTEARVPIRPSDGLPLHAVERYVVDPAPADTSGAH